MVKVKIEPGLFDRAKRAAESRRVQQRRGIHRRTASRRRSSGSRSRRPRDRSPTSFAAWDTSNDRRPCTSCHLAFAPRRASWDGSCSGRIGVVPGWLSATAIAAVTGVLMLAVFKYTSNQGAIKRVRNDIDAHLLALKLFKDSASVALERRGAVSWGACGFSSWPWCRCWSWPCRDAASGAARPLVRGPAASTSARRP